MTIRLYTRHRPSPSLAWHFSLLGQLVGQFYVAKQRELKLQQQTYVQALHETGARMTHDVKNLLQTLNVLCSAAERGSDGDAAALQALMRRHLPTVLQRLQQTLEKLQRPRMESGRFITGDAWWDSLQKTLQPARRGIRGTWRRARASCYRRICSIARRTTCCRTLSRSASWTLGSQVIITLDCGDQIMLRVCDTGSQVPAAALRGLLRGPVPSETGYGIGCIRSARQAELAGFSLRLARNEPGAVCFE